MRCPWEISLYWHRVKIIICIPFRRLSSLISFLLSIKSPIKQFRDFIQENNICIFFPAPKGSTPLVPYGHGTGSHPSGNTARYGKTPESTPFTTQIFQSNRLWNAINQFDHKIGSILNIQHLITLTYILEECIQLEALHISNFQSKHQLYSNNYHPNIIAQALTFYSQKEITEIIQEIISILHIPIILFIISQSYIHKQKLVFGIAQ